jgi:hypothetical protein
MKRLAIIIAATVLIGVIAAAVLNPLFAAAFIVELFERGPPPIAQGKSFSWMKSPEPTWTAVLRQHFPVGSPVSTLVATLTDQGFRVDAGRRTAEYKWDGLPCDQSLRTQWTEGPRGKISAISGDYWSACL